MQIASNRTDKREPNKMKLSAAVISALLSVVSSTKIEVGDEHTPLNLQKIAEEVNVSQSVTTIKNQLLVVKLGPWNHLDCCCQCSLLQCDCGRRQASPRHHSSR